MQGSERPRLAVLVDGDQHLSSLRAIQEAAAAEGSVAHLEVYADWNDKARAPWRDFARRLRFEVVQVPPGDNAVDNAIKQRVTAILNQGQIDGFWIASNDRDFAETGRIILDSGKSLRIALASAGFGKKLQPFLQIVNPFNPLPREWSEDAVARIHAAIRASPSHGGKALLSDLNSTLSETNPKFSSMDFGFRTLYELLDHLDDRFRIVGQVGGGAVSVEMIG